MRTSALVICATLILGAACTSEPETQADRRSPGIETPSSPTESVPDRKTVAQIQIYAEVIRTLVTRDNTFGRGTSPFDHVYVVDGPLKAARGFRGGNLNLFGPAPEPFPSDVVDGLEDRLQGLPPVEFVEDGRIARRRNGDVKNNAVVITLGPIERKNARVHISNGLWCGGLCGQWMTYVLRESGGRWKITGTTGPYIIS